MSENSKIEWTDHTFNPWTGCTKVSPGCANCYAESWSKRSGAVKWGKGQPRRRTKTWGDPVKWNREAADDYDEALHDFSDDTFVAPPRPRVFCASLADWLDDEVPIAWLADLLKLIHATPHLDWLLLTKRPQNWRTRMERALCLAEGLDYSDEDWVNTPGPDTAHGCWLNDWMGGEPPHNVWIGASVEDQLRADERIPLLLEISAKVRFLSCEPLLGPIDFRKVPGFNKAGSAGVDMLRNFWVIAGGESGPGARHMHPDWARTLRDQCAIAGVPFLFKQWGEWCPGCPSEDRASIITKPGEIICKFGKKAAGRRLDGQLHDAFPKA